ncbi:MAG: tol-pal system YbgF family protein [Kofleriaceae bacterium]
MAQRLGFLSQWAFGQWADREAINRNADDLATVEADVGTLKTIVQKQAEEILQLRAMLMGLVEVIQEKVAFHDAELEGAVRSAWTELTAPPPAPATSDHPYRGTTANEPSPEEVAAAKALLATAQDHHFSKRFQDARAIYQQIIDRHPDTKQATMARQQLVNLRTA